MLPAAKAFLALLNSFSVVFKRSALKSLVVISLKYLANKVATSFPNVWTSLLAKSSFLSNSFDNKASNFGKIASSSPWTSSLLFNPVAPKMVSSLVGFNKLLTANLIFVICFPLVHP